MGELLLDLSYQLGRFFGAARDDPGSNLHLVIQCGMVSSLASDTSSTTGTHYSRRQIVSDMTPEKMKKELERLQAENETLQEAQ